VRTTIDLDPDVDAQLRALARERGVALRTVINDALRAGMHPHQSRQRYTLPTRHLGVRDNVDVDKALLLASLQEDDEVGRKLDLRK
jgi:hypothetical protein